MRLRLLVAILAALACTSAAEAQTRQNRIEQVSKHGHSKMTNLIAKWVVLHAADRWQLAGWTTERDLDAAQAELSDFLKWKLGGSIAVSAQYVSTGIGHFQKGHADEAAAAIAGLDLPGNGRPSFAIPRKVAHKYVEEALYGAAFAICVGLAAMPSTDQRKYARKVKERDPDAGPAPPLVNNPSDRVQPRDPSKDPNPHKTPLHSDGTADPADMKECDEKARKTAGGAADFIIAGDIGFDIPSTQRYDVRDDLLETLILAYRYRRLDERSTLLLARAVERHALVRSAAPKAAAAAAAAPAAITIADGPTPRDELVTLLYWSYAQNHASPTAIFEGDRFIPEAAAAYMHVRYIVGDDTGATAAKGSRDPRAADIEAPPYALIPASLASSEVVRLVNSRMIADAVEGADIVIEKRVSFEGELIRALADAYRGETDRAANAGRIKPRPRRQP